MDTNKKTFNFTILFIVLYVIFAIVILFWIWFPKDSKTITDNVHYEKVDGKQKALEIYTDMIKDLLSMKDLTLLYEKLDLSYIKKYNLNENNYKTFLEQTNFISANGINILDSTVIIQNKKYIYRYKYICNNKICYVNVIEKNPYNYTISFEQENAQNIDEKLNKSN